MSVKQLKFKGVLTTIIGTLVASLLGRALSGKRVIQINEEAIATSQGQGTTRAGQDF